MLVTGNSSGQAGAAIEAVSRGLMAADYVCNRQIATAVYLAQQLRKPILVERPAGVWKTELAKATARIWGSHLVRQQCYEGLDEAKSIYEGKYGKQLLYTQILKDKLRDSFAGSGTLTEALTRLHEFGDVFFSEQFLEPRPLLQALQQEHGAVLLLDEVDKSDQEFEVSGQLTAPLARRFDLWQGMGDWRDAATGRRADQSASLMRQGSSASCNSRRSRPWTRQRRRP